jgi:hypothetical protein
MTDEKGTPSYEGWAVVELMGHRRLGGYVREVTFAGHGMLRVEMPADDAGAALTQFYSPSALYCLTPSTEQTARAALRLSRPEPVSQWDLERAQELLRRPALPPPAADPGPVEEEEPDVEGACDVCGAEADEPCAPDCPEGEARHEGDRLVAASDSQADGHRDEPEQ